MKHFRTFCLMLMLVLLLPILAVGSATDMAKKEPDLTIALKPVLYATSLSIKDTNGAFKELVRQYEEKTGKTVEVTFYSSDEDVNSKLNIELLAGGPDLISGTAIPFWSLGRRGALADIAELIENDPDVDMDDFSANIIDPFKDNEGRLFIMPCSFRYQYVMINNTLMDKMGLKAPQEWTMQNLMESITQFRHSDSKPADTISEFDAHRYIYALYELMVSIDFAKNTSHFNELDDTIFDYIIEVPPQTVEYSWDSLLTSSNETLSHYLYRPWVMNLSSLSESACLFSSAESYEVRNYPRSKYRVGKYLYEPTWAFCINNAGNTEEAWQFLKFLLSDEVQSGKIPSGYIFQNPVNINAVEKRTELIKQYTADDIESMKFKSVDDKAAAIDFVTGYMNRYFEAYTKTRNALTTPIITDPILEKSLLSTIENMAAQDADLTEVRAELTRIVDVYMSEEGGDIRSGYTVIYIAAVAAACGAVAGIVAVVRRRKKAKAQ